MADEQNKNRFETIKNLFRFSKEFHRLRTKPIYQVESYEKVLWFCDLPKQKDCYCISPSSDLKNFDKWIEIKKPKRMAFPKAPKEIEPWLKLESSKNLENPPQLLSFIIKDKDIDTTTEEENSQKESIIAKRLELREELENLRKDEKQIKNSIEGKEKSANNDYRIYKQTGSQKYYEQAQKQYSELKKLQNTLEEIQKDKQNVKSQWDNLKKTDSSDEEDHYADNKLFLKEHPEIQKAFDDWMSQKWTPWAEGEKIRKLVFKPYNDLYNIGSSHCGANSKMYPRPSI